MIKIYLALLVLTCVLYGTFTSAMLLETQSQKMLALYMSAMLSVPTLLTLACVFVGIMALLMPTNDKWRS